MTDAAAVRSPERPSYAAIIDAIIDREGGYINHPADPGGPTKYGITQKTLSEYRRIPVTAEAVRTLPRDEAFRIYRDRYVREPGFETLAGPSVRLPENIISFLVDSGVNHGPSRPIKWLQEFVGANVDGVIGPQTLRLTREATQFQPVDQHLAVSRLLNFLVAKRLRFFAHLAQRDANRVARGELPPEQSRTLFIEGWINRACEWL